MNKWLFRQTLFSISNKDIRATSMDSFSRAFIVAFEQELAWNQLSDYGNNNCSDNFEQLLNQRFVTRSIFNKDAFLLHTYFPADVSVEISREIIPKSA